MGGHAHHWRAVWSIHEVSASRTALMGCQRVVNGCRHHQWTSGGNQGAGAGAGAGWGQGPVPLRGWSLERGPWAPGPGLGPLAPSGLWAGFGPAAGPAARPRELLETLDWGLAAVWTLSNLRPAGGGGELRVHGAAGGDGA
jgi:hypothetical protein